jgi:hypothetical protein
MKLVIASWACLLGRARTYLTAFSGHAAAPFMLADPTHMKRVEAAFVPISPLALSASFPQLHTHKTHCALSRADASTKCELSPAPHTQDLLRFEAHHIYVYVYVCIYHICRIYIIQYTMLISNIQLLFLSDYKKL